MEHISLYGRIEPAYTRGAALLGDGVIDPSLVRLVLAEIEPMIGGIFSPAPDAISTMIANLEAQVERAEDEAKKDGLNWYGKGALDLHRTWGFDVEVAGREPGVAASLLEQMRSWQIDGFLQSEDAFNRYAIGTELSRMDRWMPAVSSVLSADLYPYTIQINAEDINHSAMFEDSPSNRAEVKKLADRIRAALPTYNEAVFGRRFFFRSDLMSGKHATPASCIVDRRDRDGIERSLISIVNDHAMANLPLPRHWFVRQLVQPDGIIAKEGGLIVGRERRVVIFRNEDRSFRGAVNGFYWPVSAINNPTINGFPVERDCVDACLWDLAYASEYDMKRMVELSWHVVDAIPGNDAWTVDWMWANNLQQWVLIDMAVAGSSWMPIHGGEGLDDCQPGPAIFV